MRLPWQRPRGIAWLEEGAEEYEVNLARLGTDIEIVTVRADSPDEAINKAERYLFANIYTRRIAFGGVTYRADTGQRGKPHA